MKIIIEGQANPIIVIPSIVISQSSPTSEELPKVKNNKKRRVHFSIEEPDSETSPLTIHYCEQVSIVDDVIIIRRLGGEEGTERSINPVGAVTPASWSLGWLYLIAFIILITVTILYTFGNNKTKMPDPQEEPAEANNSIQT